VLNYSSATGTTLALVRKVRMLVWTAAGVFFLARRGLDTRSAEAKDAIRNS
jgi:hypothetical protein